jgi:signal transduction histidine kinase
MDPVSRVRVSGVYGHDETSVPAVSVNVSRSSLASSLSILLRSSRDVVLLSGPPWWTLKRTVALVGALLGILLVTLLWIHLLRRRLGHEQAAQFAFSRRVLERVEDERRRIAANLHDSLGQTLLVIKHHAIMAGHLPPELELWHRLEQISGATSNAIEDIRQITHGLRPYQLDRLGLTQAIRALVNRASETSAILFASRVEDIDGIFDKEAEINVYRIIQESVTNVVKHSSATPRMKLSRRWRRWIATRLFSAPSCSRQGSVAAIGSRNCC